MRTMSFAVLALMTIGLFGARPASAAAWTCVGPEYVCGSSKAAAPSYDKQSYKSSKSASAKSHKPSVKSSRLKFRSELLEAQEDCLRGSFEAEGNQDRVRSELQRRRFVTISRAKPPTTGSRRSSPRAALSTRTP